jgi:rod shape-determining protein MreD
MILKLLPVVTVLFAALVAVLPWAGGENTRAVISFLPVILVHYWAARRPQFLPVSFVFLVGIGIDVMTNGPIGFWSLLALAAAALGHLETWRLAPSTAVSRATQYAVTMAAVGSLAWLTASLYSGATLATRPFVVAALAALVLYPAIAILMMPIDRLWDTPRARLFVRGA